MVRFIIIICFFFISLTGCMTSTVIDKYKPSYKSIYIDVVKKNIVDEVELKDIHSKKIKKLLLQWLNDGIKVDGFNGYVDIRLLSISSNETLIDNGVKIDIKLNLELIISKSALDSKKIIQLNGSEYGELIGQFSLDDKSVEIENIIKRLIERFSNKLSDELN